jgi:hypothetical protein
MLCDGTEAVPVEGGEFHVKSVHGHSGQVEYRISNSEGKDRKILTSSFEIPCSTFDIRV